MTRLGKLHLGPVTGPAILAALFCLMLPVSKLPGPRLFAGIPRVGSLLDTLLAAVPVFALALLAFLFLQRQVRRLQPIQPTAPRTFGQSVLQAAAYALPCLVVWGLFAAAYWPGLLSSDSFDQWRQAHNLALLNDWHPVGHTLFEALLTRLWDSPGIIVIVQVLALAAAWGWGMAYFESRGISSRILWALTFLFALLPYNGILLVTLWKDTPYAIVNFILVFLLGMVWTTQGAWLRNRRRWILLGFILGLTYLFRHNGLFVLILVPAALLALYRRQWKQTAGAALVAAALVILVRDGIAFGIFKAQPNPPGVVYEVPVQIISGVIHANGQVTADQRAVLERITDMKIWKNSYVPYSADSISKPWGATHDPQILDKIAQNGPALLRTLAALSIRYPRPALRAELDLTSILWEIIEPPGYNDYAFNYIRESSDSSPVENPALFHIPHPNMPLKQITDGYLAFTSGTVLARSIFWHGALALFIMAAAAVEMLPRKRCGWQFAILFVPALANVLSLAISIPGENFRFVYPYVIPVFLILLFARTVEPDVQKG